MKKTKKVKGMTLIEIIISMLVLTVCGAIMVVTGSVTKSFMRNTNHLNNKINAEAPIASVQNNTKLMDEAAAYTTPVETETVDIHVQMGGKTIDIASTKYSTAAMSANAKTNTDSNMQGHLHFYVIDTTEPTT